MLHFVTSYMKQNKSRKQTLESAHYGLEIREITRVQSWWDLQKLPGPVGKVLIKQVFSERTDLSFAPSYDYMKIVNDENHDYGVYCGEKTGQTVLVTGNYAVIIFHSDEVDQKRGFLLHFTAVPISKL